MQITVEKLSPVVVEFSVEVPADRVKSEVDKAYGALQRNARVRGFRPGKAPRHVLAHLYAGRVLADVAQKLVDETLTRALADKEVQPLSKPNILPNELKPESAFQYKARFEVRPEIEAVKYEGFEVRRPSTTASDAAIDEEIERLRKEHATLQAPEPARPAKKGDVVSLGFTLEVGGKEQPGGEQTVETEVGSGEVFRELDDALVGVSPGDKRDVEMTFPAQHPNPELKGQKGTFRVSIKEVKERVLPAVDDELAKDCGDYENLEALRAALREKQEKMLKQRAEDVVAEQLVAELCKHNPIPVPPSLVEQQAAATERDLLATARRSGQRLDATPELRARVRADAEVKVRAGLLMAEIAKAQSVKVVDEDLERGYQELSEQTGKNVAKLKAEYRDPKKREMLIAMILEDKILDIIEGAAKVVEGDPTPVAAPSAGGEATGG